MFVIANHFNSKGGDQPLFGRFQPPTLSSEVQRIQQAQLVNNFVDSILALDPNAQIVTLGDLNDFEFSSPLNTLKGSVLHDLIESLPQSERYTYVFEGNSQALDHILLSDSLFNDIPAFEYDVVHVNSEFVVRTSDHDPQVVRLTLVDTPPAIDCPADIIVGNDPGQCSAVVNYVVPTATDNCPGTTVVCSPASGSVFPKGSTTVTCTATDSGGGTASCSFTVTVNDTEAPQITTTTQTIELRPPNHSYRTVNVSQLVASATDNCDGNLLNNVVIASVSSDEPENAPGNSDGNTVNDIVIASNCKSVQLRAERDDNLNGRVYTINLKIRDAAGNVASASRTVIVPVSQSGGGAVLGPGPGYTKISSCP